jgi:hypothetical protein
MLFYQIRGDLDKIEEMEINITDIHPMDKGTGAATAFTLDGETIANLFGDKPDLMKDRMGQIHSHNNMGVFFSGTDNDELTDNAPNHNGYLSVIVNNAGDITGRFAVMGTTTRTIKEDFSLKGLTGRILKFSRPSEEEEQVVVSYALDIQETEPDKVQDEVFLKQAEEINKYKYVPPATGKGAYARDFQGTQKKGMGATSGQTGTKKHIKDFKLSRPTNSWWSDDDVDDFLAELTQLPLIGTYTAWGVMKEWHEDIENTYGKTLPKEELEALIGAHVDCYYSSTFSKMLGTFYRGDWEDRRYMEVLVDKVCTKLRIFQSMRSCGILADALEDLKRVELTPKLIK